MTGTEEICALVYDKSLNVLKEEGCWFSLKLQQVSSHKPALHEHTMGVQSDHTPALLARYVSFHSSEEFLRLLMHAVLCGEWEGCVGSELLLHTHVQYTQSAVSKRTLILLCSCKRYHERSHSKEENPRPRTVSLLVKLPLHMKMTLLAIRSL